ncbi:NAD-dependent epimerase [Neptunomonas phycophila]|uniref:NAD-dependent epimerase n=1 Tax=Neptunomonas phycophila TaxID=1572645 RepID=A0ABT9ESZ8_9GAMM|nr:NAD-dependent epimerase [Neptunomonas phycophila]MDP2522037.1 NAD-dependent epimerase [Neptunomonas phycophila]
MKVLVTGSAGFIGFHVTKRLLDEGIEVVSVDNINDYYDIKLKESRLKQLEPYPAHKFIELDLADRDGVANLFEQEKITHVIHLAAQAGVRYSIENPHAYVDSNLIGHVNILEGCRHNKIEHLIYASSSSVYGLNKKMPFSETDSVDHPVSLYAATKKANELLSHTYSHLYGLPTTGLRFFTVYGPWGRPDMSPILFATAIKNQQPLKVFNHGNMSRDFTYIDDIVEGIFRLIPKQPEQVDGWSVEEGKSNESSAPYRVYNIGCGKPVKLLKFIECIEHSMGGTTEKIYMDMQPGDVEATWANTNNLFDAVDYTPKVDVEAGVKRFSEWFNDYYR